MTNPAISFPDPSASPWTGPNNVTYIWNTDGYWEAKGEALDNLYLSKVEDDTTSGELTATNGFVGDVTGNVTGNLTGIASKVATAQVNATRPILVGSNNNNTDTSKSVLIPASANYPRINGSTGALTADGGFEGDLTGTADQADRADAIKVDATGFNTASKRPIACFGTSATPSGDTYSKIKWAVSNIPTVQGDGKLWVYNTCTANAFETTGNVTAVNVNASGNLNGTLGSGQVRNAIAQGGAGSVGTYGFLASNDGSNQAPGAVKDGSKLRWSNAAANMTNQTPSGSWRQMGRVAGDSTDFTEKQSTLWLRYA